MADQEPRRWQRDEWKGELPILYKKLTITDAELKLLVGTPKELVPAPGAGKYVEMVSLDIILRAGTEVLTESTDNLVVGYNDGTVAIGETIETTTFITSVTDAITHWFGKKDDLIADISTIVNQNVALLNNSGDFAGCASGDSALLVTFAYRIQETGL